MANSNLEEVKTGKGGIGIEVKRTVGVDFKKLII